jgi:hypothetical protein
MPPSLPAFLRCEADVACWPSLKTAPPNLYMIRPTYPSWGDRASRAGTCLNSQHVASYPHHLVPDSLGFRSALGPIPGPRGERRIASRYHVNHVPKLLSLHALSVISGAATN